MTNIYRIYYLNILNGIIGKYPDSLLLYHVHKFHIEELTPLADHCVNTAHIQYNKSPDTRLEDTRNTNCDFHYIWNQELSNQYMEKISNENTKEMLSYIIYEMTDHTSSIENITSQIHDVILHAAEPCKKLSGRCSSIKQSQWYDTDCYNLRRDYN